jgi:hypothetical protein
MGPDTMLHMATNFKLRFDRNEIERWAAEYSYPDTNFEGLEDRIVQTIAPRAKANGYLSRQDFLDICRWKTRRTQKRCKSNSDEFIRAVTSTAFSATDERLRIEVLTLLCGVEWPTASVILHFCGKDRYPIFDFRALWSLRTDVPKQYDFDLWWAYTNFCRRLADQAGVTMRMLDRALWQYSKKHQPPNTKPTVTASTSA